MNVGWVCWMHPGKQISKMSVLSGTFSALRGCGLAGKIKRLRLMTWLYLGDLAIAFQIASFTFQAWICVYICGSPATLQISYLTSVIDCYQSADRSSFTNKSVRMKGAYFTPAQQHLFKYFLLIQATLPPCLRQAYGSCCARKYSQPKRENGFNQSFMVFLQSVVARPKWNSLRQNGQYTPHHHH